MAFPRASSSTIKTPKALTTFGVIARGVSVLGLGFVIFLAPGGARAQRSGLTSGEMCSPEPANIWGPMTLRDPGTPTELFAEAGQECLAVRSALPTRSLHPPAPPYIAPPVVCAVPTVSAAAQNELLRAAYAGYLEHSEHDPTRALIYVASIRSLSPELSDLADLWEGSLRQTLGQFEEACASFLRAQNSPTSDVRIEAELAYVRCMLRAAAPNADALATELKRRYPTLPDALGLGLEVARYLESRDPGSAVDVYRRIDLEAPYSPEAAAARANLAALGASVRPYSSVERVARLRRWAHLGDPEDARSELGQVRAVVLTETLRTELIAIEALLDRRQGRTSVSAGTASGTPIGRAADGEPSATSIIRTVTAGTPLRRTSNARLLEVIRVLARRRETADVGVALTELIRRPSSHCGIRLRAIHHSFGIASPEAVLSVLEGCRQAPQFQVPSSYFIGRSLEALGRTDEAADSYRATLELENEAYPYYSVWAGSRLASMNEDGSDEDGWHPIYAERFAASRAARPSGRADTLVQLGNISASYSEAFPWFVRADRLLRMGADDLATRELFEANFAFLEARGGDPVRAGLESVVRDGNPRRRIATSRDVRQLRRSLPEGIRTAVASIAQHLGEPGLAIRWGGTGLLAERPRPYRDLVRAAAERHGVDENLIYAVMRTESMYNPRIVSYAGAVGLMQIMPRTGALIARQVGRTNFSTNDLLDPATNIDFGAWYLASLINRFDGQVPLAIASYNGGPHNVRRWLSDLHPEATADLFCEHVGFDQTYRYVRKVLYHYAAYRQSAGLAPPTLSLALRAPDEDRVAF